MICTRIDSAGNVIEVWPNDEDVLEAHVDLARKLVDAAAPLPPPPGGKAVTLPVRIRFATKATASAPEFRGDDSQNQPACTLRNWSND